MLPDGQYNFSLKTKLDAMMVFHDMEVGCNPFNNNIALLKIQKNRILH